MESRGSSPFLAGLLLAGFGLAGVLAWQGLEAARSHRAAAESVLRDYAHLAAEEFRRRCYRAVGARGVYPVALAVGELLEADGAAPTPARLREAVTAGAPHAANLVGTVFLWHPARGLTIVTDEVPAATASATAATAATATADGVRPWLRQAVASWEAGELPEGLPFSVVQGRVAGRHRLFALVRRHHPVDGLPVLVGFEIERRGIVDAIAAAFEAEALLPATLRTEGAENERAADNRVLTVTVHDAVGAVLFHREAESAGMETAGADVYAPDLDAELIFDDSYQGLLQGCSVRVWLDPAAAPWLVIGGLPGSRLPQQVALLVLTAAVLGAAFVLLRRERALTRLRTDFVARVSHELRTPLTQIRMFTETLRLDRARNDGERARALRIIDRESRRLGHLVENILQFSRSERRLDRLHRISRPVTPLLRAILDRCAPLVDGVRLVVETDLDPTQTARLDEEALQQILLNLLDNAVKYGPRTGSVWVGWDREGEMLRLWVEDCGPGVPTAQRERIWQAFERLARPVDQAVAGTGIGLAVVRDLVHRHDGTVDVKDGLHRDRDGDGARFEIRLPLDLDPGGEPDEHLP